MTAASTVGGTSNATDPAAPAAAPGTTDQRLRGWLKLRRNLLAALAGGAGLGLWQVVEDWKIHDIRGIDVAIGPIVAFSSAFAFVVGEWRLNGQLAAGEAAARNVGELVQARTDLETRLDRTGKTLEGLLIDELRLIATRLGLTGQDRVTLYKVDGDTLRYLSRWSAVPALRVRGRAAFPTTQGAAGMALKRGKHQEKPPDPIVDAGGWYQEQARMGIPKEVAAGLRMRTRHYISFAVQDRRGDRIGVIVLESESAPRLLLRDATKLWEGNAGEGVRVAELVRSWETWTEAVGRQP